MFSKILIANRGEIALRIIRACRESGIRSVAVFSEADRDSMHVGAADEAVCIGPPASSRSYLNVERIIRAAGESGADAVHPGYGYLAENETFARACEAQGITFIGPTPENLRLSGDKIAAKRIVQEAGIPVIPSGPGGVKSLEEALRLGEEFGYPVMLKAAGGGGGRGIRICRDPEMVAEELPVAGMEARAAFGNDEVYIEKCIREPRHIEFQILADRTGRIIHLGERECTIQRRYQKLVEESPSPGLTPRLRDRMGDAAIRAARSIRYFNAGTVEFLVDGDDRFYFMEVNARIQVEHPVTELVTGIDLVRAQIRLAQGDTLEEICPEGPETRGWAVECRINAEDPERGFLPCPGVIETYRPPGGFGVRLDTHIYQGYTPPIFYDSLLAKLITHARTREGAIRTMHRALGEMRIEPVKTTIPIHLRIMEDPDFQAGLFDTGFIKRFCPDEEDDEEKIF